MLVDDYTAGIGVQKFLDIWLSNPNCMKLAQEAWEFLGVKMGGKS